MPLCRSRLRSVPLVRDSPGVTKGETAEIGPCLETKLMVCTLCRWENIIHMADVPGLLTWADVPLPASGSPGSQCYRLLAEYCRYRGDLRPDADGQPVANKSVTFSSMVFLGGTKRNQCLGSAYRFRLASTSPAPVLKSIATDSGVSDDRC